MYNKFSVQGHTPLYIWSQTYYTSKWTLCAIFVQKTCKLVVRPAKGARDSRWNSCRIRNGQPSVASLGRYAVTYTVKRRQLGIRAAMQFSSENTTKPCADVFTTAEGNRNQVKRPAWGSTRSQRASHDSQLPRVNRGRPRISL